MKMDFTKDKNEIPYDEYGIMLQNKDLHVIKINYEDAYTIVVDADGAMWKVTACIETFTAVLTRIEDY